MSSKQQTSNKAQTTQKQAVQPEGQGLETIAQEAQPAAIIERARADPGSLSSNDVLVLQRTIGNQATTSLVQPALAVQRDNGDDNPLDSGQVSAAIQFYRNRRRQYTADIIRQIQRGVGVGETGTADEAMVQAVARYQQTHSPMTVDGMAGPRTLPALFPSGLAQEEEIEAYVGDARTVLEGEDWASQTPEERADALIARVNQRLDEADVPQVGRVLQNLGGDNGRFAFSLWAIRLDQATLESESFTEDEAADLADTVYHEARHAEQWYRIAQMLAGQGKTAAEIADEMGIPNRIAEEAHGDQLAPGSMEALIADGWYQSIYGRGSAHRERVLGPTGTFEEYQNLPEESDAWRVGGGVSQAYTREEEEGEGD